LLILSCVFLVFFTATMAAAGVHRSSSEIAVATMLEAADGAARERKKERTARG
jgi:hypothetical protein